MPRSRAPWGCQGGISRGSRCPPAGVLGVAGWGPGVEAPRLAGRPTGVGREPTFLCSRVQGIGS